MRKITVIVFAALLLFPGLIFSQISIKLGPVIGLTAPSGDYGGDASDFYAGTSYGLKSGLHYGAVAKVGVLVFNGRLSVTYAKLKNDGIANPTQPNSSVTIDQSLLVISLGPEFSFTIPMSPVKPYAGLDLLFSSMSGDFQFNSGTAEVSSNPQSIKSASRTGIGFAVGSEIKLGKLNLDLSFRYNMHNLFGKEFVAYSNSDRNNAYVNLNDATDPNYDPDNKHPVGKDRTIATIQVQLGVLFGF